MIPAFRAASNLSYGKINHKYVYKKAVRHRLLLNMSHRGNEYAANGNVCVAKVAQVLNLKNFTPEYDLKKCKIISSNIGIVHITL